MTDTTIVEGFTPFLLVLSLFTFVALLAQVVLTIVERTPTFWYVSTPLTGLLFGCTMTRQPLETPLSRLLCKYAVIVYLPLYVVASHYVGVLLNFAVAFLVSPLIFTPLFVLHEFKLLRYDIHDLTWQLNRMSLYAMLRGVSAALVSVGMPPSIDPLFVFLLGHVETAGMYVLTIQAYAFPSNSFLFWEYALVKSTIFLWLPALEELCIRSIV